MLLIFWLEHFCMHFMIYWLRALNFVLWYCFISVCLDNHLYVYLFKILFIIIRISSVLLKLSFFLSFLLGAFTRFDYSMCVYVIFFFRENIVSRIYSNFKTLISRLSCIFTNLSYRNWIWRRARLGWCTAFILTIELFNTLSQFDSSQIFS